MSEPHQLTLTGDAGALMRAIDWSKNPIGPMAQWPANLRSVVSLMLDSRFAMRIIWGAERIFLYNDAYRPILGATKLAAAMGGRTADVFAEVWPTVGPLFDRVFQGEAIALTDTPLPLFRNGFLEECFFTLSYSPIRNDTGSVDGVLGVVHETTDRVLAQRRLSMLRELAASSAGSEGVEAACVRANTALSHNPQDVPFSLIYLIEADGARARLVACAGLQRAQGATPLSIDLLGTSPWPIAQALRERRSVQVDDVQAKFGALTAGPYPEPIRQALVVPLFAPGTGRAQGVLITGVCPRSQLEARSLELFELTAGHLVTTISNAESFAAAQRQVDALAELARAKTVFFSNVSHEFRTPLTLMLGPLDEAVVADDKVLRGKNLETAHRNAHRLLKLVNSLLDFSRIEAGRLTASYQPTDLSLLTRELVSAFESLFENAGLSLTIDAPPLSQPAYVDREMWEKIVLNLISNAFKFTFDGGVLVSLREHEGHFVLRVKDSGIGIDSSELPHLFERFHRVQGARSRDFEGSGIGLALVAELAKLQGAAVTVESTVGQGTVFSVLVPTGHAHVPVDRIVEAKPLVPNRKTLLPVKPIARASPPRVPAANRPKVLLADDNADMREYLSSLLGDAFDVEAVTDGEMAIESARTNPPALVLTDVMMPKLDGFELLKALRAEPSTREVPVILLSARAGEESRIEGLEAGADDYLVKPFSPRELVARVRTHVELRRLRSDLATERQAATERERQQLYALFMQAPAAIAVLRGPTHVFELANAPYLALIGNRPILGQALRDALPEMTEIIVPLLDGVLETGQPYFGNEVPLPVQRGGVLEERIFNFVYQPLLNTDGETDGIAVLGSDVTELVRGREKAERLTTALQITNQELDQFAYVASHDLKAPLRAISNLSEWIEEGLGPKLDPEGKKQMELLRGRVVRLDKLINGILSYARAGRVKDEVERVDVGALLVEIRELLSPAPPARVVIGPGMPVLETQRVPLQQVMLNLVSNALKHANRADLTVSVSCVEEPTAYHFVVSDDGPGIDPEFHARIWDVFSTLEPRDKVESTGIGLSIVKKLVETRGGKVWVESQLGHGAAFHVLWPKRLAEAL